MVLNPLLPRVWVDSINIFKIQDVHVSEAKICTTSARVSQVSFVVPAENWTFPQRLSCFLLDIKPYRIQFCKSFMEVQNEVWSFSFTRWQEDDNFVSRLVFSDESVFHLNGNHHKVRIWDTEKPHEIVLHERDSLKDNVFYAFYRRECYADKIYRYSWNLNFTSDGDWFKWLNFPAGRGTITMDPVSAGVIKWWFPWRWIDHPEWVGLTSLASNGHRT